MIKLHRQSGKVSYLVYPDFDADPHPALLRSIKLSLRTRELDCHDYASSANPPVLHRKETFLPPGHPLVKSPECTVICESSVTCGVSHGIPKQFSRHSALTTSSLATRCKFADAWTIGIDPFFGSLHNAALKFTGTSAESHLLDLSDSQA